MNKKIIFYLATLILISCNQNKTEVKPSVELKETVVLDEKEKSRIIEVSQDSKRIKEQLIEECIFDQTTQTDDFLKGIKELENYTWDAETKTAEIVLNDHWSLSIKRGGCDHFELSAEFFYERKLDIKKDKKMIFDNIIWITSLIDEFDGELLKELIENDKISITKEDENNYFVNFMDFKVYELYYMSFNNEKATTFSIGYFMN